jgi:putative peptidoglycan lipid II flippase
MKVNRLLGKIKYLFITSLVLATGMAREMIVASHYGLSSQLDAYAAVLGFYVFLGNQIANTLESAFISQYSHLNNYDLIVKMITDQLGVLIIISLLCLLLFIQAENIISLLFDFDKKSIDLSVNIIKYFIPSMILGSLVGLFRAVLNIKGIYSPGFFYGIINSLSVILSIFFLEDKLGIYSLPFGYALGNFITIIVYIFCLRHIYKNIVFSKYKFGNPFILWYSGVFILLSEIIFQCGYVTERSIASKFGEGSIAAFFYAVSILMVFSTLIFQPVSTIVFPIITRKYRENADLALKYALKVCYILAALGLVAAIIIYYISPMVIEILFVRGNFSHEDATRTSSLLQIMVFVLPFFSISRVVKNTLYAKGSFKLPIFANSIRWISLLVLSFYLIENYKINGLAISYVLSNALVPVIMCAHLFKASYFKKK